MACCIGGIIAGPDPVLRADVHTTLDGGEFADAEDGQDAGDRFDNTATAEANSFTIGMNLVPNDIPDFSLIDGAPGLESYDQAIFSPTESSSFKPPIDDIFSAPSETDYAAFLEQDDLSGFRSATQSDQSNSIFGDVTSWISGDIDPFLKDYFST